MPDFHIEMNRIGTLTYTKKIQPTEDYPEPWKLFPTIGESETWDKSTALIMDCRSENPLISMVIQAPDMCTAVRILDERRKYDIVMGIL